MRRIICDAQSSSKKNDFKRLEKHWLFRSAINQVNGFVASAAWRTKKKIFENFCV
ncbi:hypothetical protein RBSH_05748 [Rhodopirellula baltica SH28]|uniref:Uncharacterized protein n=1 Tax=Rhodopirellula baltica SH28 TaxID=993517 RepID=K5D8Z7_RHOBT|nr:hypothetical protein RBSH_05748 [Rhodopirellula baltica SH28]